MEYSHINDKGVSDFEKVTILRQWSFTHIVTASKSNLIDQDESFKFYTRNVQDIFKAYSQEKGGVWCYGSAFSLMKLYQLYGYKSYVLDTGDPSVMTHATTLVEISYNGRNIISIQDPTFNLTVTDQKDNPYDYFSLLKVLKQHNHNSINIQYGVQDKTPIVLVDPRDEKPNGRTWNAYTNPTDEPIKILPDGRKVYESR